MGKNVFQLIENGKVIKTATIIINDFLPIVEIDRYQVGQSNKAKTWKYENFHVFYNNDTTKLSYFIDRLKQTQKLYIIEIEHNVEEIVVKFNIKQGADKSTDTDGFIRVVPNGITLKTKNKIKIEYEQAIAIKLSTKDIKEDACIDFYADDDSEGYFDTKGKQNVFCGKVMIRKSMLTTNSGLIIHYIENKEEKTYPYVYEANYNGKNLFLKDVHIALNYILNNGADVNSIIKKVTENKKMIIRVKENTPENNYFFTNPNYQIYFNHGAKEIIFDPYKALQFAVRGVFSTYKTGYASPAEALLHELGHAQSYINNAKQHIKDSNTKTNDSSGNIEERDVLKTIDQPAAKALKREIIRDSHTGFFYKTISPISTEKKS